MKNANSLLALLLLGFVLNISAQGTIEFRAVLTGSNEVPPNSDPTVAIATLTLEGNFLTFFVDVPAVTINATSGSINGPATSGSLAPVLFDLGGSHFHSGSIGGAPPGVTFSSESAFGPGPFLLNQNQIAELESEMWYMEIFSDQMPSGQLRGQIVMVPEPFALALWGVGITVVCACGRLRSRESFQSAK